ncbi:ankyrin repeat domain-containing protein [Rickettsiales endosymbiont of Peranema trichophorum]|uniref:ankyrin repeat domain-containing protein n=1 Tax=Rickettsiales endosymbiont of Peranema trichophorum TaxID=2486577 RepID=UPI001023DE09|nr:ankyrin repeat domain-containing protein [Rickettsiales endosymbiont of Peranema trichophorum]RZI47382.1 ankyrin repeat domain-containing protein [Rickettsiales endosymbiont of Peranema trichophorum]
MPTAIDLYICIDSGDINGVRSYLDNGGDVVNYRSIGGEAPLHHAATMNSVEMCELFLAHPLITPNDRTYGGWTPLHLSVCHNHIDVTRLLLQHKANPNLLEVTGKAPLHLAVDDPKYIDTVDLLLEVGAKPNVIDEEGLTPLSIAVAHQQKEICVLLLQRGANVNLCTEELRLSRVLSDASQEAFEILDHNDRAVLQMVGYSLALSRFAIPFEMIDEISKYYESPYWWKKFDTEDIDKLMEVASPTYAQRLWECTYEDTVMVGSDANSERDECMICSSTEITSQHGESSSMGSACSDSDSTLTDEPAVVLKSSERDYRAMLSPGNENQHSLLLNEMLAWISTLPTWFQEHVMSLHMVERLIRGCLDSGPIVIDPMSIDRDQSFESEYRHLSRYETAPYTVEKARATDYATEYHAELVGDAMMDSEFYPLTMDWNSGVTLVV